MPSWYYFARPSNLAYHDLTTHTKPPPGLHSTLGLGLKFIPTPKYSHTWTQIQESTMERFEKDLKIKCFVRGHMDKEDDEPFNPRMHIPSDFIPPKHLIPTKVLDQRLQKFGAFLQSKFSRKKRGKANLLPHQMKALQKLRNDRSILVVQCDKNLGPATIERDRYIEMAIDDHLSDSTTYKKIHPNHIQQEKQKLKDKVKRWIKKYGKDACTKKELKFIQRTVAQNKEEFAHFYLTMKVHKTPLKSRPIVSYSGTLLEGIGIWLDSKLQPVAKAMRSYLKSSFDLKQDLSNLQLPPGCKLFTADAVSMYTNIPTPFALQVIRKWLIDNKHRHPSIQGCITAIGKALILVMQYSYFHFGDTTWKQLKGGAMGAPPVPTVAQIYFGTLEELFLVAYMDSLQNIIYYKRYIDDVFGIWRIRNPTSNTTTWTSFKQALNNPQYKLEWEFSELTDRVDFMDLTVSITPHNRIITTLFEKPTNLHLYIPSHSCHPPGLLSGIIYGTLFRIYTLCTEEEDKTNRTRQFLHRLQMRGYQRDTILPLFREAITRAKSYTGPQPGPNRKDTSNFQLLHIEYHPKHPPSKELQKGWHQYVANPPRLMPLQHCQIPHSSGPTNGPGRGKRTVGIDRMVVAYSRPPNLGNLLSSRIVPDVPGSPVSSFL